MNQKSAFLSPNETKPSGNQTKQLSLRRFCFRLIWIPRLKGESKRDLQLTLKSKPWLVYKVVCQKKKKRNQKEQQTKKANDKKSEKEEFESNRAKV